MDDCIAFTLNMEIELLVFACTRSNTCLRHPSSNQPSVINPLVSVGLQIVYGSLSAPDLLPTDVPIAASQLDYAPFFGLFLLACEPCDVC